MSRTGQKLQVQTSADGHLQHLVIRTSQDVAYPFLIYAPEPLRTQLNCGNGGQIIEAGDLVVHGLVFPVRASDLDVREEIDYPILDLVPVPGNTRNKPFAGPALALFAMNQLERLARVWVTQHLK